MKDKKASEKLQLKRELTLEEAVLMAKQAERQKEQSKVIEGKKDELVLEVNRVRMAKSNKDAVNSSKEKCWHCGRARHPREHCGAVKSTCFQCGRVGHFASMCKAGKFVKKMEVLTEPEEVQVLQVSLGEDSDRYMIEVQIFHKEKFLKNCKFLIDTGADITAIPRSILGPWVQLSSTGDKVRGPDGRELKVLGKLDLRLVYKLQWYNNKVYVIEDLQCPILGRPALESMKILHIRAISTNVSSQVNVDREFGGIFNELGVFKDEFKIQLIKNPIPYVHASPRSVSIPYLPKVKAELERLEQLGIISPIEEPTDFVSPIVVVPKGSNIRICGDYTQVNKNILRPIFPIPKVEMTLD